MEREMQPAMKTQKRNRRRTRMKRMIPDRILSWRYQMEDIIFYKEATGRLKRALGDWGVSVRVEGRSYNSILIRYYVEHIRKNHSAR